MSATPRVTFVVPCYRLAHLLPYCLESILSQTFPDYEVLVMDDCSPDDTADVVRQHGDWRVQHVRQPDNIGHLANYNDGIRRARGEYLWLISADDRLRSPLALEKFVAAMDAHRAAAYVFCPAVELHGTVEGSQIGWSAPVDCVFEGSEFLAELIRVNCVPAPGAMARTSLYRAGGGFPADLPYSGDWFLWCAFALHGRVVALHEALVHYRVHGANMTKSYTERRLARLQNEIAVRWRVLRMAEGLGRSEIATGVRRAIGSDYAFRLCGLHYQGSDGEMTLEQIDASLDENCRDAGERADVRAALHEQLGDCRTAAGDAAGAARAYRAALRERPRAARTWAKYALLHLGPLGRSARAAVTSRLHRGSERVPQ